MRLWCRLPFVRRLRGRHALGAAVTGIPSMPIAPAAAPPVPDVALAEPVLEPTAVLLPVEPPGAVVMPEPTVVPVEAPPPAVLPRAYTVPPPLELSAELFDLGLVRLPAQPVAPAPTGPRVELGFADGSLRTLDPSSHEAHELRELVAKLTLGCSSPTAP